MSELINKNDNRATIRWKLLTGASALALTACVSSTGMALAEDSSQPQLWIELGGQLSRLQSSEERIDAPFFSLITAQPEFANPLKFETPPRYSIDQTGKLTFQPEGSDWSISASVKYGRSTNKNLVHQVGPNFASFQVTHFFNSSPPPYYITITAMPRYAKFSETQWSESEKHVVLDFQAGKDIGLGLFGDHGNSTIKAGVRIAQFYSKSNVEINADPTVHFPTHKISFFQYAAFNQSQKLFWEHEDNTRSFHGIGPSLSWEGSAPIAGNAESAEIAIDWDLSGAVLFGRQKASGHHQSSHLYRRRVPNIDAFNTPTHVGPNITHDRSRSVTVPNVGGSLGLSFVSGDAKVSFGYRADLFMNAMDTGIDARKTSNMFFHGPYASISIGLGD